MGAWHTSEVTACAALFGQSVYTHNRFAIDPKYAALLADKYGLYHAMWITQRRLVLSTMKTLSEDDAAGMLAELRPDDFESVWVVMADQTVIYFDGEGVHRRVPKPSRRLSDDELRSQIAALL